MTQRLVAILVFVLTVSGYSRDGGGFTSLFNGKDLTHWTTPPGKVQAFKVVDGVMETRTNKGGDLFTVGRYANFIFRFEYLLSRIGNSGVLLRCEPKDPWGTGVEVQLLAPWTPTRDDLHCTGSVYGLVAVSHRPDETTGIWHQMEIKCDRQQITIAVDGQLATVADTGAVAGMKNKHLTGALGFQSNHSTEGEFARFRNVEIRDLDADPEYVKAGFYDDDAQVRTLAHAAAVALGIPMIQVLATMMDDDHVAASGGAKQALFDIAARASAPQSLPNKQSAVVHALDASLQAKPSATTATYLKWLLAMIQSPEGNRTGL
jgi:hypothetical protein